MTDITFMELLSQSKEELSDLPYSSTRSILVDMIDFFIGVQEGTPVE